MQIILKSKELDFPAAFEEYARKKIGKFEKFFENAEPDLVKAEVEVNKASGRHRKGEIYRVEIDLTAPGDFFRSEAESGDIYSAMDIAEEQLREDVRKDKTKKTTLFKRGARSLKKRIGLSPMARFRKK